MTILTVTSKGQVTLRKDVLKHLGVKPGDKIRVDLAPDGEATLKAVKPGGGLERFFGSLHDPNGPSLTLEEIDEIIADAWAGKR
ncbi:AbrB/MazE/SpoVT family DNA-binding domain-containing protein [Mesorhizobium sp. BAC0120]|uniref:AbrB/MazE/SpoVT family DNA-binding domain-containing protein n=1 Tax=Mesorhizobium sp. BAC0120 TaxID=3090670 RepID=UPI00298C6868|nr:AbrB/MazE/SpoVT family DNA-binding domain-containing protein [Mesorhizobium sp. BAC0120]MDW6025104.1 AbrB/MazE/SpoVT family DNA-binding domain-containing protein [Mesorhizobium sp. BAC0120]